jgi:hypothetical protein
MLLLATLARANPDESTTMPDMAEFHEPAEPPDCVVSMPNLVGGHQWRVEVRDGLVFRANSGMYLSTDPPPLFALADDGRSVHEVVRRLDGELEAARKPAATLNPETLELRGGRGPLRAVGTVDLELGVASLGAHIVQFEGQCTPSDVLLGVVGSRRLREPGIATTPVRPR